MEYREPFLLISESDLTRLFYYGNRDPFPCNWFQIGSLGVRSPNAPLDVIPSDTNHDGPLLEKNLPDANLRSRDDAG